MMIEPVELLKGLLERYSPTGQEGEVVAYLVEVMRSAGFTAYSDEVGNAVGVLGDGERQIMLLGHIDTVPGWIPVEQIGDRLNGRGAVDAKGPLACFVAAATLAGAAPGWQIVVVGAVGEEGDSRGARYLRDHVPAPYRVVIGEPSGWERITLGYKGSLWFNYIVWQTLAHTSGQAKTACEQAVQFWNSLSEWAQTYNASRQRVFDQVTPTLRGMRSTSNGFDETAQLHVNVRLPEDVIPSQVIAFLQSISAAGQIQIEDGIPAFRVEKNSPLVRAFLAAIRQQGGKPVFSLKTGTADMNLVGPAWNCPILAYGPGDSNLDHTPDEHIQVSEYLRSIEVLGQALRTMMQDA